MKIALALTLLLSLGAARQDSAEKAQTEVKQADQTEAVVAKQLPSYPLKTCVISGEELGEKAYLQTQIRA